MNKVEKVKPPVKKVEKKEVKVKKVETQVIPVKEYISGKEVISKKTVVINGKKYTEKTLIDGTTCL